MSRIIDPADPLDSLVADLEYKPRPGAPLELLVVCANCSYPVVREFDAKGDVTGFREEIGPATEEQAVAEGWLDHGMGLYCPKCSLTILEDQAKDNAAQAETGTAADFGEIIDTQVLRTFCPTASDDTIAQFVKLFRTERLNKFRVLAGLQSIPVFTPTPKDEDQVKEFTAVLKALEGARK